MNETEELTDRLKQSWIKTAIAGATIFQRLQESLNLFPSREQWEYEFQKQLSSGNEPVSPHVMDALWKDAAAAGREFDRIRGKRPMAEIVKQTINWERVKTVAKMEQAGPTPQPKAPTPVKTAAVPAKLKTRKQNFFMSKKKILLIAATLFALAGIIPPWQFTADVNGKDGFHSRQPAGYALIFDPPDNPNRSVGHGVQIDVGRLFLEWAVLAVATGMVWVLVVKPAWACDEKSISSKEFIAPTGNPKN